MDWIEMKEAKERLNEAIIPFDELAALAGGIDNYIQIKPDQKEFLGTALEKLKRQRQSAMNIVTLGNIVNANIKDCVMSKKEIDEISRAFLFHKVVVDNIEWGPRATNIVEHLSNMNKTFKEMVKIIINEELKDPDEETEK
jgi:ACT domain-containing protein